MDEAVDEGEGGLPGASATERPVPSLRAAMRTARVEEAERSRAITDVRSVELARLDQLRAAIEPVLAQVPPDVDLFDCGVMPGLRPRLFIDMVAFVEMEHDRRHYRFVQDTRQGRTVLATSDGLEGMVEAITAYIARRLVERERALAEAPSPSVAGTPPAPPRRLIVWTTVADLVLRYLGIVALCVLVWVLGWAFFQHFWAR